MVDSLRRYLILAVVFFGLFPAQGQAARSRHDSIFVPVLIYHHVKWLKPTDNAIERGLTVLPTAFAQQLQYLTYAGFHLVSALQIVKYLQNGSPLPAKPVVLTFDDGYTDMATTAFPILKRHHMIATFFIVPGFLNSPRYLTWPQVENMARNGMDIEAHTMTHPDLTVVPRGQVRGELRESRKMLEERLHQQVRIFAYPYGAYNATVVDEVAKAGYWAAFTTHAGWNATPTTLFQLPRVYVDIDDTSRIFAGRLIGDPATWARDPV